MSREYRVSPTSSVIRGGRFRSERSETAQTPDDTGRGEASVEEYCRLKAGHSAQL